MSPALRGITTLPATRRVVARSATSTLPPLPTTRPASAASHQPPPPPGEQPAGGKDGEQQKQQQHYQAPQRAAQAPRQSAAVQSRKSMAELDEELRLRLEGISGEGGASGVEYENGRAEGLKRGVKSNMFRVI